MSKTFLLEIVTPEKVFFSQEVSEVLLHAADGYMTVLPDHAPFIGEVLSGEIVIKSPTCHERLVTYGGFVQIENNKTTFMLDDVHLVAHLDEDSFDQKIKEAKESLENEGTMHAKNKHEDMLYQLMSLKRLVNIESNL